VKVVVDTNVFVSGFLSPFGRPAGVLRLVLSGKVGLLYDIRILSEYREVLSRPKFHFKKENIEMLLEHIQMEGQFAVAEPLSDPLKDPSDEMFLEIAVSGGAECLVTGNLKHFPAHKYEGIYLLDPAGFMEHFQKKIGE